MMLRISLVVYITYNTFFIGTLFGFSLILYGTEMSPPAISKLFFLLMSEVSVSDINTWRRMWLIRRNIN